MRIRQIIFIFLFINLYLLKAQEPCLFWIGFSDKNNSKYSLESPSEFLSERAINRRQKQNIPYAINDLPVNQNYIDSIKLFYPQIRYSLKWLNGVVVKSYDSIINPEIYKYNFVKGARLLYSDKIHINKKAISKKNYNSYLFSEVQNSYSKYGYTYPFFKIVNGLFLHYKEYLGDKIVIAVLDAGFNSADELPIFDSLWLNNRIVYSADFVSNNSSIYNQHSHGMNVLSLMGGNMPGMFIGSAPNANFCLVRTEDVNSEFVIEEYNWAKGAEYADSIGADIINSSLGYYQFDDSTQNYRYENLDGNTSISTRAADIAASKGILVVVSAGNEGDNDWRYINAPADGDSVLSVGAVNRNNMHAKFSSYGPRIDGKIKPNIMAPGDSVIVQQSDNTFDAGFGTSLAAPIISGFAACLWQAFPEATNMDIIDAIQMSSSHYLNPNDSLGYGTPDFEEAFAILYKTNLDRNNKLKYFNVFPNPFSSNIYIFIQNSISEKVRVDIFTMHGNIIFSQHFDPLYSVLPYISISGLENCPNGLYIVRVSSNNITQIFKIIKN